MVLREELTRVLTTCATRGLAYVDSLCVALLAKNSGEIRRLLSLPLAGKLPRRVREEGDHDRQVRRIWPRRPHARAALPLYPHASA